MENKVKIGDTIVIINPYCAGYGERYTVVDIAYGSVFYKHPTRPKKLWHNRISDVDVLKTEL